MRNALGLYDDYSYEWPTDESGSALVLTPGAVATTTGPNSSSNWIAQLFQPAVSVANTYITQRALTERQRMQLQAGVVPQSSTIGGIPILYIGLGLAALLIARG